MAKKAFISGITGQDGCYLAKLLLEKGYEVFGGFRQSGSVNFSRLDELGIRSDIRCLPFDLLETTNVLRVVQKVEPDEIYNLAAQSSVALSFEQPAYTADADALGVVRFLEVLRIVNPKIRFFQASSSEMYGKVEEVPQTETTRFRPRSPYGAAKLYAHWITVNYRENFGVNACSGILFNHDSPLRSRDFVSRKITAGIALIQSGLLDCLELGNIQARRDWGFAGDYVEGMWRILQADEPDDFVLATGTTHSIRDFVIRAAEVAGFGIEFEECEHQYVGRNTSSGNVVIRSNSAFFRTTDVDHTVGDASKARETLAWSPSVQFDGLVQMMVEADMDRIRSGCLI